VKGGNVARADVFGQCSGDEFGIVCQLV
jgi:hypothetical protein